MGAGQLKCWRLPTTGTGPPVEHSRIIDPNGRACLRLDRYCRPKRLCELPPDPPGANQRTWSENIEPQPAWSTPWRGCWRRRARSARLWSMSRIRGNPVAYSIEGRGGAIIDAVKPIPGESIVTKVWLNAFTDSELDSTLKRLTRRQLVIAGFIMHMSVRSTTGAALDLGYKVTVFGDVAAIDVPALDTRPGLMALIGETLRVALAKLSGRLVIVA